MIEKSQVKKGTEVWYWYAWNILQCGEVQGLKAMQYGPGLNSMGYLVELHVKIMSTTFSTLENHANLYLTIEEAVANRPPRTYSLREWVWKEDSPNKVTNDTV